MYTIVVTIHIIVCIILVLTVLLQQGKGAEVGAVFGSSEAMFGSAGPASALSKLTTVVAIIFMLTSLGLTYLAAHRKGNSVMEDVKVQMPAQSPMQGQAAPVIPPAEQQPVQAEQPAKQQGSLAVTVESKAVKAEDEAAAPETGTADEAESAVKETAETGAAQK